MPIYLFSNPSNEKEVIEVVMSVHDEHIYIKDGVKWDRVFTKPTAAIDTVWNPDSKADFSEKSGRKKGTLGQIMDKAAELSDKRAERTGKDPIKQSYYDSYAKTRDGKRHPEERKVIAKELTKKVMENINIKLKKKS